MKIHSTRIDESEKLQRSFTLGSCNFQDDALEQVEMLKELKFQKALGWINNINAVVRGSWFYLFR
jgi:hypothetical protein